MAKSRGAIYEHVSHKKGFGRSQGSYRFLSSGDRVFVLVSVRTGKTRTYESQAAAMRDGWVKVK